jgi:hypothetical protein
MRKAPSVRALVLCASLAVVSPGVAHPQAAVDPPDAKPYPDVVGGRTLNGHRFLPAADAPWPFTVTSLASYLILGYGETTSQLTIRNQTFGGTREYAAAGGFLGYEYAFLDYFSARATIAEYIFSGVNGNSALAVGTQVQIAFDIGATASLPIGDTARVGILLDYATTPRLGLTIATGLSSIVNSCQQLSGCVIDTSKIFGSTNVHTLSPALAASWSPLRGLGLTTNVAYQHVTSTGDTTVEGDVFYLAGAVDYDFGDISSVPIGLQLQASWSAPFSGSGIEHVTDFGGGIFYTGRKDLAAGVQLLSRRFAVTSNVDVSWRTFIATMGLRYFWQ